MNKNLDIRQGGNLRVLGIDPGFGIVGFGLVEQINSLRLDFNYLDSGAITTEPGLPFAIRLNEIYDDMMSLLTKFKPDIVVIEKLFFATNVTTAMKVAEARGVILLACQKHGCQIEEFTPLQIKLALTGDGKAKKAQVKQMVLKLLKVDKIPGPDDVVDALAIAMTYT